MNKPCLILGIGGSGTNILNTFVKTKNSIENIIPLAIDTDNYSLSKLDERIIKISLTENEMLDNVYQRTKQFVDKSWFSDFEHKENANLLKILKTNNGAHSWRQQGFLSFADYLLNDEKIEVLNNYIDLFASEIEDNNYEIYLLSSTNGGTGSGIFLSLSLYLKKYIKDKYDLDIRIKMMLVCPDVYENSQNYDERKKSYANAYAALKELNAVNLVTNGFNDLDEESTQDIIDFKISIKDKILFDSHDRSFWNKNAFPYEKIYLFERIPTLMSVATHEQIIASSLDIILNTKQLDVVGNSENIYAGISISRILYPSENIIDYLLHRYLLDELDNEWLYIFKKFTQKNKFLDNINKTNNQGEVESILNLFNTVINNEEDYYDLDLHFLNRTIDENNEYFDIKYDLREEIVFLDEIKEEFLNFINKYHNYLDSSKIDDKLNEKYEIENIKFFDSKKTKNNKKNKLVERVKEISFTYKEFIIDSINNYFENADNNLMNYFENIINKLITNENNEFVNPIIALYRLVNFYTIISDRFVNKNSISMLGDISEERMKFLKIDELPLSIFKLKGTVEYGTNTYLKAGENVLLGIIEKDDTSKLKNLNLDYKYIIEDFKNLVLEIKMDISEFYFKNVLSYFDNIIKKYIEFFKKLKYSVDDLEYEVKELKNLNTNDTLCLKNIASSIKEKEELYLEFVKSIKNKKDNDSIIGKLIFNFINDNQINDINRGSINKIRKDYLMVIKNQMNDNEIIQKIRNQNVFEASLKSLDNNNIRNLRKVFSGILNYNFRPLNLNIVKGEKIIRPTVENTVLISEDIKEFICKNSDKFDIKAIEENEKIIEFFSKLGNSNNKITVSNLVINKEMLTIYEVSNLDLSWLKNIDEETNDSYYYKEFYESLEKKINTNSFLWNPSLYKVDNYDIYLPTINLDKQVKIDINNIKALVYEFINKKIIISDVSSDIQNVYFHQAYLDFEPLKYYDEHICNGEITKVIKLFRNNSVFNTETSEKFDHYIKKLSYSLPYNDGFNEVAIDCIINAIYKSSFVKVIQEEFLKHINLDNLDIKENIIYIDLIVKMMIQIFDKMLKSRLANVKIENNFLVLEIKKLISKIFSECYEDLEEYEKIINKNFKK